MRNFYRKIILNLFIVLASVLLFNSKNVYADSSFWIEYIDVGQGDAALVQCDGHYMLIDGGPADASSTIYTILKNKKIQSLDYIIATHPDADHIGGLSGALNYASTDYCFCPVASHDTKTFNSLIKYLAKRGTSITIPNAGAEIKLGSATVKLLGPVCKSDDINNNSIVTKIEYGSTSFIFMGDAETEEEQSLISSNADLKCDVIKIGHHGSRSSTSQSLIKKTKAKNAIISVGSNSYGHPTKAVLNRLYNSGIAIYRTDKQGDITCISDGKNISFITEKEVNPNDIWESGDGNATSGQKASTTNQIATQNLNSGMYVLNTNTKKFHVPSCSSVRDMKEKNRQDVDLARDEIILNGFSPCKRCNP